LLWKSPRRTSGGADDFTDPGLAPRESGAGARAAEWFRVSAEQAPGVFKPFAQSLYVDLAADPGAPASRVHLGYRLGHRALVDLLGLLREAGVHHVALNLKYGVRSAGEVLEEIGAEVLPHFVTEDIQAAPQYRPRPRDSMTQPAGGFRW